MFTKKTEIRKWLKSMKIYDIKIHDDLTVDVNEDVYLKLQELTVLPVQFGIINGGFYAYKERLTTLKGLPTSVEKDFSCDTSNCSDFTLYAPQKVGNKITLGGALTEDDLYCIGLMQRQKTIPSRDIDFVHRCKKEDIIPIFKSFYYESHEMEYILSITIAKFIHTLQPLIEQKKLENIIHTDKLSTKVKL